jgi:signal peptidase II
MNRRNIIRVLIIFSVIILNIGCDQASKQIVRQKIADNATISVIKNHLTLTRVENSGAFLSLGNELQGAMRNTLLNGLPLLALVLGLGYIIYKRNLSPLVLLGICFIIGGGFGNLYDRLTYGSVTDFMHIRLFGLQTGVFNMADVSIMTGSFLVALAALLPQKKQLQAEEISKPAV